MTKLQSKITELEMEADLRKISDLRKLNSRTETIVSALRILSVEIQSGDGIANAVMSDAADRLTLLSDIVEIHTQEINESAREMKSACKTMDKINKITQSLKDLVFEIDQLNKESK